MQVDSLCPICRAWYAGPAGHRCLGSPLHQVQAERDNSKRLLGELNQKMLDTLIALTAERERSARLEADAAYYKHRLQTIVPLFEEARDALCAIPLASAKLRNIDLSLGARMDVAGTYSREEWDAAITPTAKEQT